MTSALDGHYLESSQRERAVILAFSGAAIGLGAFAALGSPDWLAAAAALLLLFVSAWIVPESWCAIILAALIPIQLYFSLPDSTLTLRGATVFVFAAGLRLVTRRGLRSILSLWMLPAFAFVAVAIVGAIGAQNRYLAFKGLYDWLPVLASILVAREFARTETGVQRICIALVVGGVAEAALGLVQYILGLESILELLRLPVSELFYQPNLLRERLVDLSFNWVVFDRATPFGTFINAIDFSLYLAAILSFVLALVIVHNPGPEEYSPRQMVVLLGGALVMGGALLLTFKGSGSIALAGGIGTIILVALQRTRQRTFGIVVVLLSAALVLAIPFSDLLMQRAAFLIQREQGGLGTAGRLEIWGRLLQYLPARLFFGYGLNNATLITEPARTLSGGAPAFVSTTPESAYVAALIETGTFGFLAVMALMAGALIRGFRGVLRVDRSPIKVSILAALVALLVGNLTVAGFTTDQNGMLLGSLIGMVWGGWNHQ